MSVQAALLAVGTEVTSGQIVNRNAGWLSDALTRLGAEVVLHLAVPDDRSRILDALRISAHEASLVFITGGLGPTTDDFTRDLVGEWSGRPGRASSRGALPGIP